MKLTTYNVQLCQQTNGPVIVKVQATSKPHALKRAKKLYPLYAHIVVL